MADETIQFVSQIERAIETQITRYLRGATGLDDSAKFLESFQHHCQQSEYFNMTKLAHAQTQGKAIESSVRFYEDIFRKLENKNFILAVLYDFIFVV